MKSRRLAVAILVIVVAFAAGLLALNWKLDRESAALDAAYEKLTLGGERVGMETAIEPVKKCFGFRRIVADADERIMPGLMPLSFMLIEYESNRVSYVGILSTDRHDIVRREKGRQRQKTVSK